MNTNTMKYFFTFGQNHFHPETGEPMKDYWIEVDGKDYGESRELMFASYGDKWGMQYEEGKFQKEYFPKGCYETLHGNKEIVFSLKPMTAEEAVNMIMKKVTDAH